MSLEVLNDFCYRYRQVKIAVTANRYRQNTKFRSLITDTRCTRKNSRHISHDINTPDKLACWFLEYKIHPTIQEADLLLNKILPAI